MTSPSIRLARRLAAPVLMLALLGAVHLPSLSRPITFDSPAGTRPAGVLDRIDPFSRILPSGRIVRPTGTSVVVGMNTLGFALTPDGRFAIATNDAERGADTISSLDSRIVGGYSLTVVDTASMKVVDRYSARGASYFFGVAAVPDPSDVSRTLVFASGGASNSVYAFDLDAGGHITPDKVAAIAMPLSGDGLRADYARAFPSALVASLDGSRLYVVNNISGTVATIDTARRATLPALTTVGFFPLAAALAPGVLLVANEGLMSYGHVPTPTTAPPFVRIPADPARASSLSRLILDSNGTPARADIVSLDTTPDGTHVIGGAHPAAIVPDRTGRFAFVAMANVDRIATVALTGTPRVVGGTELRLFDKGPYGTQPSALALSKNGARLYVALSGINAIAVLDVRDAVHPHRIGLIPTGWCPTAIALSGDGRTLFVANAKGIDHDTNPAPGSDTDGDAVWSTLESIDLDKLNLGSTTMAALSYQRVTHPLVDNAIVPQRIGMRASRAIKHVVVILQDDKTYDAMLGDLRDPSGQPYGAGDASLAVFGSITPNLHALARTFALATNFYVDSPDSDAGHQFAASGVSTLYTERTLGVKSGRAPLSRNQDPEDYPRAGYVFDSLARRGVSYRDYGDLVRLSGYEDGLYTLDVPGLASLAGHIDLAYPGWNVRINDTSRAAEFVRDFDVLEKSGKMPGFTSVWLPTQADRVEDSDRALGAIVDYLSHLPEWKSTAIFVMPASAQSARDHIDSRRAYAIVISPYARRHYLGANHLSSVSVLKTEEELLGLPTLSLGDTLAGDLRDFFTLVPDDAPFSHVVVPGPA